MDRSLSDEAELILSRIRQLTSTSSTSSSANTIIKYGCIAANSAIFLAWQFAIRKAPLDEHFWAWLDRKCRPGFYLRVRGWLERNFLYRAGDEHNRPWTLITSAFSHMDAAHFATNMTALNTFFRPLALALSPIAMIGLIMSTAMAGNVAFRIQQARFKFPNRHVRALGFSGVGTGMGTAAAILFPYSRAVVYGVSMPVWAATGAYFAWDVYFLSSTTSTIGHAAHVGGAVAGAAYVLLLKQFGLISTRRWLF